MANQTCQTCQHQGYSLKCMTCEALDGGRSEWEPNGSCEDCRHYDVPSGTGVCRQCNFGNWEPVYYPVIV